MNGHVTLFVITHDLISIVTATLTMGHSHDHPVGVCRVEISNVLGLSCGDSSTRTHKSSVFTVKWNTHFW